MEQLLVQEPLSTLQRQVDALAVGTNPVVYFPVGTKVIPARPEAAKEVKIEGEVPGCGTYYFLPFIEESRIRELVEAGLYWKLLGFVQSKEEVARGNPKVLVARDAEGVEIRTAAVDANNVAAVLQQKFILDLQFPGATVEMEEILDLLRERKARK